MMEKILVVKNLRKWFSVRRGFSNIFHKSSLYVKAVDGVSFNAYKNKTFCLVGESGSGKTTVARTILRLEKPTDGKVYFKNIDVFSLSSKEMNKLRRKMQIIFQDPYESLNPHSTIHDILIEPLIIHKIKDDREERIAKTLEAVGLSYSDFIYRFPHELSGGQRQRVSIARALILEPEFLVLDEPVSMLDMSIRASILNLLINLKKKLNTTYLYITHDLSSAKYICDHLAILYLGKIMEIGLTSKIIDNPLHPYTKALISAVPTLDPDEKIGEVPIRGEIPTPLNIPPGCRFHPRCLYADNICREKEPPLIEVEKEHYVACHKVR